MPNLNLTDRFFVFCYNDYYPGGGINDLRATYGYADEGFPDPLAVSRDVGFSWDTVEIVDTLENQVHYLVKVGQDYRWCLCSDEDWRSVIDKENP